MKLNAIICYTLGAVYKGRPANGEGGGFEISDIPGRGEGGWFVKVRTSEKIEIPKFKIKTRNYNRSRFQYESIHI